MPEFLENIVNGNAAQATQIHERSSLPKFGTPSSAPLSKFGNGTATSGLTSAASVNGGGGAEPKKNDDPWAADSDD